MIADVLAYHAFVIVDAFMVVFILPTEDWWPVIKRHKLEARKGIVISLQSNQNRDNPNQSNHAEYPIIGARVVYVRDEPVSVMRWESVKAESSRPHTRSPI